MKNADFRLQGGLTFAFLVPETVEEYNNLAADASACLDSAIDNVMYRGPFARLRERLAQRVEEQTSIARARKPHPSPEQAKVGVTVFDESPGGYISRAAAELGKDSAGDAFQSVFDEMLSANAALQDGDANKIVFDPSERVSRGPSATAGKGDGESIGSKCVMRKLTGIYASTGGEVTVYIRNQFVLTFLMGFPKDVVWDFLYGASE